MYGLCVVLLSMDPVFPSLSPPTTIFSPEEWRGKQRWGAEGEGVWTEEGGRESTSLPDLTLHQKGANCFPKKKRKGQGKKKKNTHPLG